jgi:uncharacterized membrane protein
MIQNPVGLVCVLLCIEIIVLFVSRHPKSKKYFEFLPSVFWIYFIPMMLATSGVIDSQAAVYTQISTWILPASLLILLMTVDIRAILRLGKEALIMMLMGSVGIVLGVVVVFSFLKGWLGKETWSGWAALAGSWTGGSANMIAVKEALQTPEHIFTPMVVVDTIVPYVWMGILVACSRFQKKYDAVNRVNHQMLDEMSDKAPSGNSQSNHLRWNSTCLIVLIGFVGGFLSRTIAQMLPVIKDVISTQAWTIILVTLLGIGCSLTPLKRLQSLGSNKIGYFILFFVLTAIGAKASLSNMNTVGLLIGAGFIVVLIHMSVLLLTARLMKAPLALIAAASQANVGGVASAPIVAEVYRPGLASVGLMMAVLGNIIGTYIGILTGQICRFLAG